MSLPEIAFAEISPAELSVPHVLEIDPLSGEAIARIPVPAPPGRGGMGPAFALEYHSRSGNSPFGVGWIMSGLPMVSLDAGRSLPRYDGTDLVHFGFGGEMVPTLVLSNEAWVPRTEARGAFWIRHWRARSDASSIRLEQWTEIATGRVHWRSRDGGNTLTIFGRREDGTSRIADPDDGARVLTWLPDLQIDAQGSAIVFEYVAEDARGIDRTAPFEQRHYGVAPPQRYLKSVRYSNTVVATEQTPDAADNRWSFTLVFDYGDHRTTAPLVTPDQPWPARPDPFSNMRGGFDLRTWRLCRRILTFHSFDALGPQPVLTRELVLGHSLSLAGSTLQRIEMVGSRTDPANGMVERRSMPPLLLTYSQPELSEAFMPAPVETGENAPGGLSTGRSRWVDLFGEGLPGLLSETDTAWYFKPNEGDGHFGAMQLVAEKPSSKRPLLSDFNGDGQLDAAVLHGRIPGYFERELDGGEWRGFRPIGALPHVEAASGHAQWLDLTGDGRQDLLVSDADQVTWFAAGDDERFGDAVAVARTAGGAPVVEDPALGLFFADLNGDGLSDQVRVRNGFIEYWPQLGHGRFADTPIVMENAPVFASDHDFDPRRVRFVRLTGNGGADLCYFGSDAITFWQNAQGNRWLPGVRRAGVGVVDTQSSISVLDFLGDGRPCLVWSSPLVTTATAMQYLPLTGAVPPGFLLRIENSLGRVTEVTYASSARHYLRDRLVGRAWRAGPAQHVIVGERIKVFDQIGDTFGESRYEYHDGYYDTNERRFVGFGLVDRFDAEYSGPPSPDIAPGAASCERTWFHPGNAISLRGRLSDAYSGDLDEWIVTALEIESPADWTEEELSDAISAMAGRVIRTERYSVDAKSLRAPHPIETTQHAFVVRRQQPSSRTWPASVLAYAGQTVSAVYEGEPADPRVAHELTLDVDRFGLPTLAATIAYRRRPGIVPAVPSQAADQVSIERRHVLHRDEADRLQIGVVIEVETFEVAGLPPPVSSAYERRAFAALVGPLLVAPIPHHEPFAAGAPRARRLTWEQQYYWNDSRTAPASFGTGGVVTLPHHLESAAFAEGFTADAFGARVDTALLQGLGYVLRNGHWWQSEPVQHFLPADEFSLPVRVERSSGGATTTVYDEARMFKIESVDPVGNRIRGEMDYQTLAPNAITDANGTRSEVRYDPLGVVTVSTTRGDILDENGALQPLGNEPLSAFLAQPPPSFAAVLAAPAALVQNAALIRVYDLDGWTARNEPPKEVVVVRERFVHDGRGTPPSASTVKVQVSYFDGFGRERQLKVRAEPGPALMRDAGGILVLDVAGQPVEGHSERWMTSGGVIYDRAQRPVRQFEPFYSVTPRFEPELALLRVGRSMRVTYDALGRNVREDLPNGAYTRTEYHAWEVVRFDANDTIADAAYRASRLALPATHPERIALAEADGHAGTPSIQHLDPAGRDVRQIDRNPGGGDRVTTGIVNAHGRTLEIIDPRGVTTTRIRYDMLDRTAMLESADAGTRWTLADAQDRTRHVWAGRDIHQEVSYDELDRLVSVRVDGPSFSRLAEQRIYGDDATVAQGAERNARGQLVLHRDPAGVLEVEAYDLSGRACRVARRICATYQTPPDWRVVASVALDADVFRSTSLFDALGRPIEQTFPDGSRRRLLYAAGGGLRELSMDTNDGMLAAHALLTDASFNARGQQIGMRLGNGVVVTHDYEAETHLTSAVTATRTAQGGAMETLQQLRYAYDPNGNLVHITDAAQEPGGPGVFLTGANVSPASIFKYDHFGRVIAATGRLHQALLEHDYRAGLTDPGAIKGTRHLTLNNGAALERYTRTYRYDASGNLLEMRHLGQTRSWTSTFWVSASSNRSLPSTDPNGIALQNPQGFFDANGNCSYMPNVRRLEWTDRNTIGSAVLIERQGDPNDVEFYVYDGNNLRVRKVAERLVNNQIEVTEQLYLDGCEIKRVSLGGQLRLERFTSHVSDGYTRVALVNRWRVDTLARETNDTTRPRIRYQLSTHVGSASLELDEQGARVSYEEYFPFGGTAFIAGDAMREVDARAYRYCGKERDDSTGLYYFEYRYYAPGVGRFMSPDPSGPDRSPNLFLYAENDPINGFDPEGLDGKRRAAPAIKVQHIPWDSLPAQYREQGDRNSVYYVLYGPTADGPSTYSNFATMKEMQAAARRTPGAWIGVYDPRWQRHYEQAQAEGGKDESARAKAEAMLEVDDLLAWMKPQIDSVSQTDAPDKGPPGSGGDVDAGGDAAKKKEGGGETGQDGTGGAAKDATGAKAGDNGTTASSDAGASNSHDGDGASTSTTAPGARPGGNGTGAGDSGTGPGAGRKGKGPGGGGEGTGTPGAGTTGEGKGRGKGRKGAGSGGEGGKGGTTNTSDNLTPAGTGNGTGSDGVPGGISGGSKDGSLEGAAGGIGMGIGGVPTTSGKGGGGQTSSGDPNGDPNGTPTGSPKGTTSGTATTSGGAGGDGQTASGTGNKGGIPHGNGTNPDAKGTGQASGQPPTGDTGPGKSGQKATVMDKITTIAGYTNLEFSGAENGQSGGVPGGMGTHNWGSWGQGLYVALSVVGLVLMFFGGAGIKAGLRATMAGIKSALVATARVFTKEGLKRIGAKIAGFWAKHSIEIAVGKGAIRVFPIHAAWNAGGRWLHAFGSKPLYAAQQLFNKFRAGIGSKGLRTAWTEAWTEFGPKLTRFQTVMSREAADFASDAVRFRLPALFPQLAGKAEGRAVLSCITSTWNAWSRTNLHIPNLLLAGGTGYGFWRLFGGGSGEAPQQQEGTSNAGAR